MTNEQFAKRIRDNADPLWRDMKEARRRGLHDIEVELADIVVRIHEVGSRVARADSQVHASDEASGKPLVDEGNADSGMGAFQELMDDVFSRETIERYHELVDASFIRLLSDDEQAEQGALASQIDAANAPFHAALMGRLREARRRAPLRRP